MFSECEIVGEPSFDLSRSEIETIVELTINGVYAARLKVTSGMHEPPITKIVRQAMDAEQRIRKLRIDIDGESELDHPDGSGKITGRIDIRMRYARWAGEKSIYFGIEAKKISSKKNDTATKYVDDGVERFVDSSYCAGQPTAMMLGYLLEGDGPLAHKKIDEVVQKRYGSAAALKTLPFPPKAAAYAGSVAVRKADQSTIFLIHLAVNLPEAA